VEGRQHAEGEAGLLGVRAREQVEVQGQPFADGAPGGLQPGVVASIVNT